MTSSPADYSTHSGYFGRDDSGPKGPNSYLVIDDRPSLGRQSGVAFTIGPRPNTLPDDAISKKAVVAVAERGGEVWDRSVATEPGPDPMVS